MKGCAFILLQPAAALLLFIRSVGPVKEEAGGSYLRRSASGVAKNNLQGGRICIVRAAAYFWAEDK